MGRRFDRYTSCKAMVPLLTAGCCVNACGGLINHPWMVQKKMAPDRNAGDRFYFAVYLSDCYGINF